MRGGSRPTEIVAKGWSTLEWLHFLRAMPDDVSLEKLGELDRAVLDQSKMPRF